MSEAEVIDIGRSAIWVMIKIGGPVMLIALAVGFVISLIQALTQIQEMTLSFVPKMLIIFGSLFLLLPFMLTTLTTFTESLVQRIVTLG